MRDSDETSSASEYDSSNEENSDEEIQRLDPKLRKYNNSPKYDYLMFLYEFDPENGHITGISDMFIPESSKYVLSFPSGLVYIGDELWILYGDHDSYCKVMSINKKYVSKLLHTTPENSKSFLAEDIKYFTFPETCYKKEDICKLLFDI